MLIMTGDVPRPASACTVSVQSGVHGVQHMLVTAHTEVVIGAPDSDSFVGRGHVCARKLLSKAINVVEVAV